MKGKGIVFITMLFLIMLLLSGCWSRKELKSLGVVGFVAMDKKEELVDMTLEIITPKRVDSTTEEKAVSIIKSKGKTISSAITNVTSAYDKELTLSHTNAYIFSEKIAKEGMNDYIEFLNRYYQTRRYVHLAITKDMEISELITIAQSMDEPASQHIEKLYENYTQGGKSVSIKLIDFLQNYYEEGIEPVAGVIQSAPEDDDDEEIAVNGLAVFKGDKLVGFFDDEETRSYNILTNRLEGGTFVTEPDPEIGTVVMEVLDLSSSFGMTTENDELNMSVTVALSGMVIEVNQYTAITKKDVEAAITENYSKKIESQIIAAIKKAQSYESDIFGFGQYLHRYHPKEWHEVKDNWEEIFQGIEVSVDVQVEIERVGVTNEPVDME